MLPDITVIVFLESEKSFPLFAEIMQMSPAALYVRLTNFLEHRFKISNENARWCI